MSSCVQEKALSTVKLAKCTICENHKRTIEEVRQILKGRDAIIAALKAQLNKNEINYRKLFDNYEKLRLEHSLTLLGIFNLQGINSKLEEISSSSILCFCKTRFDSSQNGINLDKQQSEKGQPEGVVLPYLEDVTKIEKLIQSQHKIISEILEEVEERLFSRDDEELEVTTDVEKRSIGDCRDIPAFRILAAEIQKLKVLVNEHEKENDRWKKLILKRRNNFTLHTTISTDIEDNTENRQISSDTLNDEYGEVSRLKSEMDSQEKFFEESTRQMMEQLEVIQNANQVLSETLDVITAENRNNLDIIRKLNEEKNRLTQETEDSSNLMRAKIRDLENELEDYKESEKKLKHSVTQSDSEIQNLQNKLRQATEENVRLKENSKSNVNTISTVTDMQLDDANLLKQLAEKSDALEEREEEIRGLCQRMEILMNYNQYLRQKLQQLDEELAEISQEVEKIEEGTDVQAPGLDDVQEIISQLNKDKEDLIEQSQADKKEIKDLAALAEQLKARITAHLDEIDNLGIENEDLKKEIKRLKDEYQKETATLQQKVNQSQMQVETLLEEHDKKTEQIEIVASELDNIRRSITEENDNLLDRLQRVESERDEMVAKVATSTATNFAHLNAEIDRLNAELVKKQAIIAEMGKSFDDFNGTMKTLDKTAEELAIENETLKADKDIMIKDLKALKNQMTKFEDSKLVCALCSRVAETSEKKNKEFKTLCQLCFARSNDLSRENEQLQKDLDRISRDNDQMKKANSDSSHSELEFANIQSRKKYDALKILFDKAIAEIEKYKQDLIRCVKCWEESKNACGCMDIQNENLKQEVSTMKVELDDMAKKSETLRLDCVRKCLEVECLKKTLDEQTTEKRMCEKSCDELKNKQKDTEKELIEMKRKLEELETIHEQKIEEYTKMKQQCESTTKNSSITREDYATLRKEYKDIKSMLSEQVKRFKSDLGTSGAGKSCNIQKIKERETQIMALQQKLKDASYEIIELKDYIHKLISDNNLLKSGINNLVTNLERKIKGTNMSPNSTEAMAGEILQSLATIENIITKKRDGCIKNCQNHGKDCDCMMKITSQYSFKEFIPSTPTISEEPATKERILKTVESETNTTDSEENMNFIDKKSVEFLKNAILDLKIRIDSTMKEKSCDCEEYWTNDKK